MNIQFDGIRSLIDAVLKRCKGILRGEEASATVCYDYRLGGLSLVLACSAATGAPKAEESDRYNQKNSGRTCGH